MKPATPPDFRVVRHLTPRAKNARLDDRWKFHTTLQRRAKRLLCSFLCSSRWLISGAGNDAVDYSLALKNKCAGIGSPEKCFDDARLVHLVDGRGCLDGASDRDSELQPNSRGFEKLAAGPRRTALAKYAFAV